VQLALWPITGRKLDRRFHVSPGSTARVFTQRIDVARTASLHLVDTRFTSTVTGDPGPQGPPAP